MNEPEYNITYDVCEPELSYDSEDDTWWLICCHCGKTIQLDTAAVLAVIPVEELESA